MLGQIARAAPDEDDGYDTAGALGSLAKLRYRLISKSIRMQSSEEKAAPGPRQESGFPPYK